MSFPLTLEVNIDEEIDHEANISYNIVKSNKRRKGIPDYCSAEAK